MRRVFSREILAEIIQHHAERGIRGRGAFSRADNSAYRAVLRRGFTELIDLYFTPVRRWTLKDVAQIADKFLDRSTWAAEHPASYSAACRLRILDRVGPPSLRTPANAP